MQQDETIAYLSDRVRERLAIVHAEVAAAAHRAGRDPASVQLIAVTKTHPPDVLTAAVAAGVTAVGENYPQEAAEKFATLGWPEMGNGPVTRHLIGHLQTNKARLALRWFDVIQTVDSLRLAVRLNEIAAELGRDVTVLLQINSSGEPTKSGFFPQAVEGVLPALANLAHIRVSGLMAIGRFEPDPEAARTEFQALRALRDRLAPHCPLPIRLTELSMGMSHDFPVAIEEGATMVRVGSRLFGPR